MIARAAGTRVPGVVLCVFGLFCGVSAYGATPTIPWGSQIKPPPTNVKAGGWYIFRPAAPPAGASFLITNKPSWATFDRTTGQLIGRPVNANAGIYANVQISVTNGKNVYAYPSFPIIVYANPQALSIGLTWLPPTQTEDGAPLTNLLGYRIYRGPTPDRMQPLAFLANPGITRYVMDAPPPGRHYFAITAVNSAGAESDFSPVVAETFE